MDRGVIVMVEETPPPVALDEETRAMLQSARVRVFLSWPTRPPIQYPTLAQWVAQFEAPRVEQ